MPTVEDRMAVLERKVAAMELERLYEQRKAEENTPAERTYNLGEINQNITILLGIASSQEKDIKTIKNDLAVLKESIDQRFDAVEQRFVEVDRRFDAIEQHFTSQDAKFDQVLQQLTILNAKLE